MRHTEVAARILQFATDPEWLAVLEPTDRIRNIAQIIEDHVNDRLRIERQASSARWELDAARQRQEETERRD